MSMFSNSAGPRLVAVSVALLLGLSACGGGNARGGQEGGDSDEPIKIGTSLPLTGEFSQPGQAAKEGYEVWQEMVNEGGGLLGREVELIVKDDASNQNTVVADFNALISQDRVDLLLGTFSSLLNLPASAVAERNQMLYIEPAGGSPEIFNRGFEYLFYTQQATADKQGDVFAHWIAGLPEGDRPKTAAYPTIDDPFAVPTINGIKKILEDAGIETVYEETYAIDTKNFDTIVNAMKAKQPELVVHGAVFEDGVGMVRAMRKANFTPGWLYQTSAPSHGDQYAEAIGVENTDGILYAVSHAPEANTPGNAEFVAKYEEMFRGLPPEDAADAYATGQVLKAAVEAVGNVEDQEAMADWLRSNSVETILGEMKWQKNGAPDGEFLVGQWQDGRTEIILPDSAATTEEIIQGWKPGDAG
jgi:branched-chain amino acid transport system substrate-binding protein